MKKEKEWDSLLLQLKQSEEEAPAAQQKQEESWWGPCALVILTELEGGCSGWKFDLGKRVKTTSVDQSFEALF